MTRAVLWAVPVVAVVAAVLAGGTTGAVAGALAIGMAAGVGLWSLQEVRVRRVLERARAWRDDAGVEPPARQGAVPWRQLQRVVDELGSELATTREELRGVVPWAQRLVASLDEPAFVFSPDGWLAAANDAGRRMAGLGPEADASSPLAVLGSVAVVDAIEEARSSGQLVAVDDDRGGRNLRITASPLDDDVLVVVGDRTRERQVEELRRDFVVNASHELKTPVTAIATLVEALQVAPDERRDALVDRLTEQSQRLTRLAHDLLDLRMLEEDDDEELVSVDLVRLVRAAAEGVASAAESAEVEVVLDLPDNALVAGRTRDLALVVDNLVANAVQYNRPGGRVTVALRRDDGTQVLTVADTGIGIPEAAVDRVFERFYRVDVARSRARGGTGLGLSIVRNAVERHGGHITVASHLEEGTTFTVRLPVEPAT